MGEIPFFKKSKNLNIFGLRGRMELGVGALESLGPMESIWGAWGVFQALAHNRHALEKKRVFWGILESRKRLVCLVGAHMVSEREKYEILPK